MATKKKELLEQEAPVTETVMCRPIPLNLNPSLLTLAMVWI